MCILYYHFVHCRGLAFVGLFIFPPSLILFSYDLMTIFNATFGFLVLFCVCVSIIDFWFVVIMRFKSIVYLSIQGCFNLLAS